MVRSYGEEVAGPCTVGSVQRGGPLYGEICHVRQRGQGVSVQRPPPRLWTVKLKTLPSRTHPMFVYCCRYKYVG